MARGTSLLQLLPELVRTLLGERTTVRFPFEPPQLPEMYRGRLTFDPDQCVGCGLCVRDCPASSLELERESREKFRLVFHEDRCAHCGQCAANCRHGAISLVSELPRAAPERSALTRVLVAREPDGR